VEVNAYKPTFTSGDTFEALQTPAVTSRADLSSFGSVASGAGNSGAGDSGSAQFTAQASQSFGLPPLPVQLAPDRTPVYEPIVTPSESTAGPPNGNNLALVPLVKPVLAPVTQSKLPQIATSRDMPAPRSKVFVNADGSRRASPALVKSKPSSANPAKQAPPRSVILPSRTATTAPAGRSGVSGRRSATRGESGGPNRELTRQGRRASPVPVAPTPVAAKRNRPSSVAPTPAKTTQADSASVPLLKVGIEENQPARKASPPVSAAAKVQEVASSPLLRGLAGVGPGVELSLNTAKVRPFLGLTATQNPYRVGVAGEPFTKVFDQYFADANISESQRGLRSIPQEVFIAATGLDENYIGPVQSLKEFFKPPADAPYSPEVAARTVRQVRLAMEATQQSQLQSRGKPTTPLDARSFQDLVDSAERQLIDSRSIPSTIDKPDFDRVAERNNAIYKKVIEDLSKPEPTTVRLVKSVKFAEAALKVARPLSVGLNLFNLALAGARVGSEIDKGQKTGDFSGVKIELSRLAGNTAGSVAGAAIATGLAGALAAGPVGLFASVAVASLLGAIVGDYLGEQAGKAIAGGSSREAGVK
jgi:hypothetical protein